MRFYGKVTLRGANGKTSTLTYDFGNFAEGTDALDFAAAQNALTQVTGALANVTDAEIAKVTLSTDTVESSVVPASGDIFELAQLTLALTTAGKYASAKVPAPVIGIFSGATGDLRDVIDINDAALVQYVQQLEQHTDVSDGETIDATIGSNGLVRGHRVVRAARL